MDRFNRVGVTQSLTSAPAAWRSPGLLCLLLACYSAIPVYLQVGRKIKGKSSSSLPGKVTKEREKEPNEMSSLTGTTLTQCRDPVQYGKEGMKLGGRSVVGNLGEWT